MVINETGIKQDRMRISYKIFLMAVIAIFLMGNPVSAEIINKGNLPGTIGLSLDVFRGIGMSMIFPVKKYVIELYGSWDLSGIGLYSNEGLLSTGNSWFYYGITAGNHSKNYPATTYDVYLGALFGRRWENLIGHLAFETGPLIDKDGIFFVLRGRMAIDADKFPSIPLIGFGGGLH
jgi:hypothetical protein